MMNTDPAAMTCKTKFAFENDAIPMFYIKLYDSEDDRTAVVALTIADAFEVLKSWNEDCYAATFQGGCKEPCSICWYNDPDGINNTAISVGGVERSFWLGWDDTMQLIESLQSYVLNCAKLVGGH